MNMHRFTVIVMLKEGVQFAEAYDVHKEKLSEMRVINIT
jgi:hypothetical protein